jgi:hypothetical protein
MSREPTAPELALLDAVEVGVLGVERADGTVHLSAVYHARDGRRLVISTEPDRLKARAVRRTGRATYCVVGPSAPFPSVAFQGRARLLDEGLADATRLVFARAVGTPVGAPRTDEEVRAMNRTVIELHLDGVYAASHVEPAP